MAQQQQPATLKRHLRARPDEETEPGVFVQEDGSLSQQQHVRLRSLNSVIESTIIFCNDSPHEARAVWVDFQGNEVAYSVLEPGAKKKYRTYATHPWIIRTAVTGERLMLGARMVLFAQPTEQTVSITAPPSLQWSLATHKFFPEGFRATTKALLLTHARLRSSSSALCGDLYSNEMCSCSSAHQGYAECSGVALSSIRKLPGGLMTAHSAASDSCATISTLTASSSSDDDLNSVFSDDDMGSQSKVTSPFVPSTAVTSRQGSISCAEAGFAPMSSSPSLLHRLFGHLLKRNLLAAAAKQSISVCAAPPADEEYGCADWQLISELPADLVLNIVRFMAPEHRQCIMRAPEAGPNILPAMLPSDPAKWEPVPVPAAPGAQQPVAPPPNAPQA